jgi:choline dehydrogenase-like flavoprotein
MLLDARTVSENEQVETDLCIIGAGPAGIAIAREFIGRNVKVCVLESGGAAPTALARKLNEGRSVGYWYYPLSSTRERALGGTSAAWWHQADETGRPYLWRTRPLDAIDFESRPGIAHSGWPFTAESLMPFFVRAQRVCQLGAYDYDVDSWEDPFATPRLALPADRIVTTMFQYGDRTFAEYGDELAKAPNVTTMLNGTVCDLVADPNGNSIRAVTVKTEARTSFTLKGRVYVLAAGGIENPRLLLASNATHSREIGNAHDLVGRYFMERLAVRSGVIVPADPGLLGRSTLYGIHSADGAHVQGALCLNETIIRSEGLLNAALFVLPAQRAFTSEGVRSAVSVYRALRRRPWPGHLLGHAKNIVRDLDDIGRTVYRQLTPRTKAAPDVFMVRVQAEQSPNPSSRVTLDRDRDRFGVPKPKLDWQVTDFDRWSIRRTQEIVDEALREAGVARLERMLGDENPPALFRGAYHHMGTTRMHSDPSQGVVDANCRVHGYANLFVAGSSVFPTSGNANPTLTIVALAIRLADHLKDELA